MTMIGSMGFGKPRRELAGYAPDADFMRRLYYGKNNLDDGMPINTTAMAVGSQEIAKDWNTDHPHDRYIPLAPPIPDDYVRKAIFGYGTDPTMPAEEYEKDTAELRKAWYGDLHDYYTAVVGEGYIQKAETMGASNLMHVIADDGVTYMYKRPYPLQALLPAEANRGKQALWDAIGPFEFGSAFFGVEDENFVESDIVTHNRTADIKFGYAVGRVTKAGMLAGRAQVPPRDLLAIRIDAAQDAVRALRERSLLGVDRNVSQTVNTFVASGANEYPGMYQLITANTTASNWINEAGQTIDTYDKIMKELDKTFDNMVIDAMSPNLAICDYKTFGVIRRGLTEYFRTDPVKTFVQGISKISLVFPNEDGLALIPHPFLPQAAGDNGSIFLIDTRLWSRRVLWQDTYEELAKLNLSQKFVISFAECLIDKSDVGSAPGTPAYSLHGGLFGLTIT